MKTLHLPGRRNTRRLILRRILVIPLGLFCLVTFAFFLTAVLPSNPGKVILGDLASPERIREINHQLGLDAPLGQRYLDYWKHVLSGNLGTSYYSHRSVWHEIATRAGATLELVVLALVLAFVFGVGIAMIGVHWRNRSPDRLGLLVVSVSQAIPPFVVGVILLYVFSYQLNVAAPPSGQLDIMDVPPDQVTGVMLIDIVISGDFGLLGSALGHLVLPVAALAFGYLSFFARIARPALERALDSDQAKFARALGLSEFKVLRYAWLEARIPVISYGGQLFAEMIGTTAIIETLFAWNGLGQWAIDSILKLDIPSIQGFVLVAGLTTFIVFLLLDVTAQALDPRIQYVDH